MPYPYTSFQIQEIVSAGKTLRRPEIFTPGRPIPFTTYGECGKKIDLALDLSGSPSLIELRFHVRAPIFDNPETFEAALILFNERVRGIGWHATGRTRFYGRQIISPGWHQNIIDPNLPSNQLDKNRHLPIGKFEPIDLAAFLAAAAELWHISLPIERSLL